MSDERRDTQAFDRATRLCDTALKAMEATDDYRDERLVLFVSGDKERGLVTSGYDDEIDALVDVFSHLRAIFKANGKDLMFAPLGRDG